jgi:hypothetical protein
MLEKRITVQAAEIGKWIPLNRRSFGTVGFTVAPQEGAGGTYSVEFTEREIQRGPKVVGISRTATVLTIPLVNHGLTVGDSVVLYSSRDGDYEGVYQVASVVDLDSITVAVPDAGQTAPYSNVIPLKVDVMTDFDAATGKESGNIFASVTAVRLNCTNSTTAPHDILINQFES